MYNVIEKIGSVRLTIHTTKNKASAERIARQLQQIYKNRVIIVSEAKKP